MASLYRLVLQPSHSLEEAWAVLEAAGFDILYGSEEEGIAELYVHLASPQEISAYPWIDACTPHALPSIDWESQWKAHGLNFHDGCIHVNFEPLGRTAASLRLRPGAGFGDLSHPTTRLMLKMLAQYERGQTVIDIGCGSGILTLASAALGAPVAYGIDIDFEAVEHSRQNALLNDLSERCIFCTPSEFHIYHVTQPVLILINMIHSEQSAAWESLPSLHGLHGDCLASGVREEERRTYLDKTRQWGWTLRDQQEESGWLAFTFNLK